MSQHRREEPFSESDLDCPEYRERLLRKLNCLIALLDVALARVHRSLGGPDPDHDRLRRIQGNLRSTLDVCRRARAALERREALPADLQDSLAQVTDLPAGRPEGGQSELAPARHLLPLGARVEMSSGEEARRFEHLGPIPPRALRSCDLDELARLLQGA